MTRSVRLDEMAEAMTGREAPLQPESAIFVALQAIEAMREGPRVLRPEELSVDIDGHVGVSPNAPRAEDESACCEALVSMLEGVLEPLPGSVIELSTKVRGGQIDSLAGMQSELQAMLVPFNRGAAQRVLGRMARDHLRVSAARASAEDRAGESALLAATERESFRETPGAEATWIDEKPVGMRAPENAGDTEPDAPTLEAHDAWAKASTQKKPTQTSGLIMLLVSLAALLSGAWFLWTRVRGG